MDDRTPPNTLPLVGRVGDGEASAGAGGVQEKPPRRSRLPRRAISRQPPTPAAAQPTLPAEGEGGGSATSSSSWAPAFGQDRRKDHARAGERARRLRREPTASEARLWKLLRRLNREGAHFRRQVAIGEYVYDFADFGARLLIELDGGVHALPDVQLRDAAKSERAAASGFNLLRITNADVWGDWARLTRKIAALREAPSLQSLPIEGRVGLKAFDH